MPLPTPTKQEDKKQFISRCMSDPIMKKEYGNKEQRTAVCFSQYRKGAEKRSK